MRVGPSFSWCVKHGFIKQNPVASLHPPKNAKTIADFLTREQYEQLLRCIEADATLNASRLKDGEVLWLLDVVKVAVGSGMRLSELCNMRWSWINLKTGFITVKNTEGFTTKSGHERSIYVTGDARAALQHLYADRTAEADSYVFQSRRGQKGDAEKLNEEYVSKRFLYYARMARLPEGVHFHTLRHTYASWLFMAGVDLFRVKELLGHADISTTMRYAHLAPKSFKNELERVFGGDSYGEVQEPFGGYTASDRVERSTNVLQIRASRCIQVQHASM